MRGKGLLAWMSALSSQNVVEKLSLHGILPAQNILSQFDAGLITDPSTKADLLKAWTAANTAYSAKLASDANLQTGDVSSMPASLATKTSALLGQLRNYPPFDSHKTEIAQVRVSKLLTPQLTVTVPRLRQRAPISRSTSLDELVKVMFEVGKSPQPVFRQTLGLAQNGGALLYTSYDEDVRLHHPPFFRQLSINEADPASPSHEAICIPVGGGLPFAYAFKVQSGPGVQRLVLANGIHRLTAAALAGLNTIPLILTEFTPLEVPDPFVETPKQLLLDPNVRPPMIGDFADPNLTMRLKFFRMLKTVRFNWNFENYVVPVR
jgi:hypothetical protein